LISQKHQVRKHPKNAPGGQVLDPTRYENRGKVRLVGRFMVSPDGKSPACPQKHPFLRMDGRKTSAHPQQPPQTWTEARKDLPGQIAKGKTRQIPMFPVAMCPGNPDYD